MKRFPFLHRVLHWLVVLFGNDLTDERTGEKLGRALIFCWRGRIHLLGLDGENEVVAEFLPQDRMAFWERRIGFTTHPPPDFPRERNRAAAPPVGEAVCFLVLAHQSAGEVAALLERWRGHSHAPSELLLAYGGPRAEFDRIAHERKFFVDDPRLRTRHHQREKQSYSQIFQRAAAWLNEHPACGYVYFAEYDHWPLVPDLGARLIERLRQENADVLGHQLHRRDGTSHPHYLYHRADPRFLPWLCAVSRRHDPGVVFNMLGSGSFWTREAFLAVASQEETVPVYLEIYLPTLAHHLGFRLRPFGEQDRFVWGNGDHAADISQARAAGAWTIHPVKSCPEESPVPSPAPATDFPR
jgi:hypothetical protein